MARKLYSKCVQCRRRGEKLFLKGERCYTPKCAFTRRSYAPGQHGQDSRGRMSEFGMQLQEKQKARGDYDILEKQFRAYFEKAARKKGVTGELLLQTLESRLDNVIYRMQLAKSRRTARQVIRHGHIQVNGQVVDIPSFLVSVGDSIAVLDKASQNKYFEDAKKMIQKKMVPGWLDLDADKLSADVSSLPTAEDVERDLGLQQIVEYYSR